MHLLADTPPAVHVARCDHLSHPTCLCRCLSRRPCSPVCALVVVSKASPHRNADMADSSLASPPSQCSRSMQQCEHRQQSCSIGHTTLHHRHERGPTSSARRCTARRDDRKSLREEKEKVHSNSNLLLVARRVEPARGASGVVPPG